jgi:hypothetical protein
MSETYLDYIDNIQENINFIKKSDIEEKFYHDTNNNEKIIELLNSRATHYTDLNTAYSGIKEYNKNVEKDQIGGIINKIKVLQQEEEEKYATLQDSYMNYSINSPPINETINYINSLSRHRIILYNKLNEKYKLLRDGEAGGEGEGEEEG